jgi:hypothetical protein
LWTFLDATVGTCKISTDKIKKNETVERSVFGWAERGQYIVCSTASRYQESRREKDRGFFPVTEPGGKQPLARLTETTWGLDRAALPTVTVLGAKACFRSKLLWSYI